MTKKARLTSVIASVIILLLLVLTGLMFLEQTDFNEDDPASAASTYISAASTTGRGTSTTYRVYGRIYIYCDNTAISSISSTMSYTSTNTMTCQFKWSGEFTVNLRSGYLWRNTTASYSNCKFAWGSAATLSEAQQLAYDNASSASTLTYSRNGNAFTTTGTIPNSSSYYGSSSSYPYAVGVLILNMSTSATIALDVTASISNPNTDKATVDKDSARYTGSDLTFTFTANPNYYINTIKINNADVTIADSAPSDFTSITNVQYKCYRNNNQVIVVVTQVTWSIPIVATYADFWNVSSNKGSIVIQTDETIRENYFSTTALLVAEYSRNQNLCLIVDGVTARLKGNYSTGTLNLSTGSINYVFNVYNEYVVVQFSNLNVGQPYNVQLDYYVGMANNINANFGNTGSGTIEIFLDDDGVYNLVVTPNGSNYVQSMTFDNVNVVIEYYKAEVYGVGTAETVSYVAKDNTNIFLLKFDKLYGDINVTFNLINTKPTYKVPPQASGGNGAIVTGTVVTAVNGGEARIVGFDYEDTDNDTIRFIAVAYKGYNFAGWQVDGEILEGYGMSADIPYELVQDKIVTAVFEPIQNSDTTNSTTDNDQINEFA